MQLRLSILTLTILFTSTLSGNHESKPRTSGCRGRYSDESEVKDECIHNGERINSEECRKRCQKLFEAQGHDNGLVTEDCKFNGECECKYLVRDRYNYKSLSDLEEEFLRKYKGTATRKDQAGTSHEEGEHSGATGHREKRCAYRYVFITAEECQRKCQDFVIKRDGIQVIGARCEEHESCKCIIESKSIEDFVFYERLDTLEAQCQDEGSRETEEKGKNKIKPESVLRRAVRLALEGSLSCGRLGGDTIHKLTQL